MFVDWNKDWQPGPYPTTEKEKVAAAKKYGLRRDDYEPYPDDGFGHGDYPNLPRVSDEGKDKYYNWDLLHVRRNYGEPVSKTRKLEYRPQWGCFTNGRIDPM